MKINAAFQNHISSLPGLDDITRVVLPNGIVVLARPNFNSSSVIVSGYLPVGSIYDPDERLGLANFTANALMDGTSRRDYFEIHNALESVGASLGFDAGTHTGSFRSRALVEDLDLLLELISESLQQPTFPPEHLERLRAKILTGLALRAQNTGEMASLTFDRLVYENHPYGRPGEGYPETIQPVTREEILSFHKRHYGPKGMVVVVVGGVDPAHAVDKIAHYLGDWENPSQAEIADLPDLRPLDKTVREHVRIPEKSQTDLVIGVAGPPRRAPGFLAASLGNNAFGQFGMYGRIGDVVREKEGLAYYVYSALEGGIGPGPWYVAAGVDPENLERAIDLIWKEIERLIKDGIGQGELGDSQANFIGRLPLSLESNAGVAAALLNLERYQLGLDYYQTYEDRIRSITVDEVHEVIRKYLDPEKLTIATAGV